MTNFIISIVYLVLSFMITLIFFKKYGKYGLYIWMCLLVIISNIQTVKISELFGLTISLGNISYGAIFLATDILSEKYGRKATLCAVKISFIVMIIFTIFMLLFLQYEPSNIDKSQEALLQIFNYIPRITISSLIAYYLSQSCDTYLYNFLKKKYHKVWISNNVSTFISQIFDTLIFVLLSFIGEISFENITQLIITMLIFKWIIALLDTPFMIYATSIDNFELDEENEYENKLN